jgi:hypothetical protein
LIATIRVTLDRIWMIGAIFDALLVLRLAGRPAGFILLLRVGRRQPRGYRKAEQQSPKSRSMLHVVILLRFRMALMADTLSCPPFAIGAYSR